MTANARFYRTLPESLLTSPIIGALGHLEFRLYMHLGWGSHAVPQGFYCGPLQAACGFCNCTLEEAKTALAALLDRGLVLGDIEQWQLTVPAAVPQATSPDPLHGYGRKALSQPEGKARGEYLRLLVEGAREAGCKNVSEVLQKLGLDPPPDPPGEGEGDPPREGPREGRGVTKTKEKEKTNEKTDENAKVIAQAALDLLNALSVPTIFSEPHPIDPATLTLVEQRLAEGFGEADFLRVVRTKVHEWGSDERMRRHLRPRTLFGEKMAAYASEPAVSEQALEASWRRTSAGDGPGEAGGDPPPFPPEQRDRDQSRPMASSVSGRGETDPNRRRDSEIRRTQTTLGDS